MQLLKSKSLDVLLVDDDAVDLQIITRLLKRISPQSTFTCASTLAEVRHIAKQGTFHIALLDANLPDGSGLELLSELSHTPCIIITDQDPDHLAKRALDDGAQDFLPKSEINERRLTHMIGFAIQRMRLQKAERLLRENDRHTMLSRMTSQLSHELNNPLAIVKSNMEYLQDTLKVIERSLTTDDQRQQLTDGLDALGDAMHGTDQINGVIKRLQRLNQLNKSSKTPTVFQLRRTLDTAIDILHTPLKRLVQIDIRDEAQSAIIEGSFTQLTQLFIHLINNALEAAKSKNPAQNLLRVTLRIQGKQVVVIVEDNGHGLTDETKDKAFEPFFTTHVNDHSGLGLPLCMHICLKHQGSIELDHREEGGARVVVTLPLAENLDDEL